MRFVFSLSESLTQNKQKVKTINFYTSVIKYKKKKYDGLINIHFDKKQCVYVMIMGICLYKKEVKGTCPYRSTTT